MSSLVDGACPLCGRAGVTPVLTIAYADVWERLQSDWGVILSPDVRAANAPAATTTLVRCTGCGLERFEPMVPGSPEFYAELAASMPYVEDRWDFSVARSLIHPDDDVADFGAGEGRFLASLGARKGRTVGVDHNRSAIDRIVARGDEAYACSFEEFAEQEASGFDVVATFHTIEHVADPLGTVRAAARCLRPDGRMLVSVPNRKHLWREEGAPLDRPPHHVTRWTPKQMKLLASAAGLELMSMHFEPPHLTARLLARQTLDHPDLRFWARMVRAAAALATVRSNPGTSDIAGDAFARRGVPGHTMLAELGRL